MKINSTKWILEIGLDITELENELNSSKNISVKNIKVFNISPIIATIKVKISNPFLKVILKNIWIVLRLILIADDNCPITIKWRNEPDN